jgi:hypothetical protein
MKPDDFRPLVKFDTFQPFRLYLKDGRTYDLLQPGLMLVFRSYLFVGIPAPGETKPIFDESVDVPYDQIDRVELLSQEPTKSA